MTSQLQNDLNRMITLYEAQEKKLKEYIDYMVKVRRIQQDNTKEIYKLKEIVDMVNNRIDIFIGDK